MALYNILYKGGVTLQDCSEDLKGRVQIAGDYDNRECGLEITNLTQSDSGSWECEVKQDNIINPAPTSVHLFLDGGVSTWRLEFREKTQS